MSERSGWESSRSRTRRVVLVTAAILVLAACGGGETSSNGDTSIQGETSSESAPAPSAGAFSPMSGAVIDGSFRLPRMGANSR